MSENNSIILTKNLVLTFQKPVSNEDFVNKIREFANNVILYLKNNGCDHVGHIKFISTTNGEDYLQLSVLDMEEKPKINGILKKTFEKIKLTLNVIVFGIKKEDINQKITEEIESLKKYFNVT
ncbi:MAG: hypothetical protein KJ770_04625 [Actinobacteria bacterium]|nr:hypothetical protein [Actinomycetota bacterium]